MGWASPEDFSRQNGDPDAKFSGDYLLIKLI